MNKHSKIGTSSLIKPDLAAPVLFVTGREAIGIKAGTIFAGHTFAVDTDVKLPDGGLERGTDYAVCFGHGGLVAQKLLHAAIGETVIGGFHFAPGGNASARAGGDDIPAINPHSLWDLKFRPTCPDPGGMTRVQKPGDTFWCDIYLAGANCAEAGTSVFGATIADGDDRPVDAAGKKYKRFDYETAVAVMSAHGKQLLSVEEFFAAAIGVTEKSAASSNPVVTGLDALRTSKFGLMQATGNMWVWGHDGDPDTPRPSVFGGSWWFDDHAGSRCADLGDWPDNSDECIGARGRSDHLQLV
jgi:hypothetical protein